MTGLEMIRNLTVALGCTPNELLGESSTGTPTQAAV